MAIVSFTNEYKRQENKYFEKVRVEKGDTDRVAVVTAPERFYVHQMNMPVVLPNGEVEQETLKNAKGEDYQRDKTEFVGAYLCKGKDEALATLDGFDPDNCELCAAIKEYGDTKFRRPEPKYACYVVKYRINTNGEPQLDPFQVELLLWVMTQHRFDQIVRIANEHGDPMKLDLLLGPCKNTLFQAYDIAAGGKCYWRENEDRVKFVASLIKSNKIDTDEGKEVTKNTVARSFTPTSAEMAINKVLERHALIGKDMASVPATAGSIDFGGAASASREAESAQGWTTPAGESTVSADAPSFALDTPSETQPTESATDSDDSVEDFSAILSSLGVNTD